MHKFLLLASFAFLFSTNIFSQQLTDVINSNRPSFSFSPYNPGVGMMQVESGLMYHSKNLLANDVVIGSFKKIGLQTLFRYTRNSQLEFFGSVGLSESMMTINLNDETNITKFDFSTTPIMVGAVYRINEGSGYIPTIGFKGSAMYYDYEQVRYFGDVNFSVLTQHDFEKNWVFISNINIEKLIYMPSLSYTFTLIKTILPRLSVFIENKGELHFGDDNLYRNYFDGGLAYLVKRNFQLDVFGGLNTNLVEKEWYVSLGFSWRFNGIKFNNPVGAEVITDPFIPRNQRGRN
ncbi:MAG: transporter [Ichthyobacteriaceae bacterium]|nr:transporter [Ichthyobacteriaceae bacterium]